MPKKKKPRWQAAALFITGLLLVLGNVVVIGSTALKGDFDYSWAEVTFHALTLGIGALMLMPDTLMAALEKLPLPEKWRRPDDDG